MLESSNDLIGWKKNVLSERDDGEHELLTALYCCFTVVEALTLQIWHSPTHIKRQEEVLARRSPSVYMDENGRLYSVFDWKARDNFIPVYETSEE